MKLKRLEIIGFKSFAEKEEFFFDSGITVFVGPNGCGKSNIVDAIRWILGEQRPKSLRGKEMQDVIFNGGGGRSPSSFSQASITLINSNGTLPLQYKEYKEICITRRLYRSGESEYLINNALCRLKDIRELFMGTGVGMDSYSIMEQGNIDVILKVNPLDRRMIFEEAAGISLYKNKRLEAERKLEKVEQNLLRVTDVVREISRQIRSTKIQATRARKFKEFQARYTRLKLDLALFQYRGWEEGEREVREELSLLEEEMVSKKGGIFEMGERLASREETLKGVEEERALVKSSMVQVSSSISAAEERLDLAGRMAEDLKKDLADKEKEREFISRRLKDTARELELTHSALSSIEGEVGKTEGRVRELESEIHASESRRESLERAMEKERGEGMGLAFQEAKNRNRLTEIGLARRELESRSQSLLKRREELRKSLSRTHCEVDDLKKKREEICSEIHGRERDLFDGERALKREGEEVGKLSGLLEEKAGELFKNRSTLEILKGMEERLEGISPAVKEILRAVRGDKKPFPGVKGIVADLIQVDPRYSRSVDRILGPWSQAVVTETLEEATRIVSFLKEKGEGTITLLPLESFRRGGDSKGNGGPPGSEPLLSLVECKDELKPLFEVLFAETRVVEGELLQVLMQEGRKGRYVTPQGEIYQWPGIYTGGRTAGSEGLISQKAQMRVLRERTAVLSDVVERMKGEVDQRREFLEARRRELLRMQEDLDRMRLDEHRIQGQEGELSRKRVGLEDEEMVVKQDLEEVFGLQKEEEKEEEEIQARLKEETAERKKKEEEIRGMESLLKELNNRREKVLGELAEVRVSLAEQKEKGASHRNAVKILEKSLEEGRRNLNRLEREMEGGRKKLQESLDEEGTFQTILKELRGKERELSGKFESFQGEIEELKGETASLEEDLERERKLLEGLEDQKKEKELRLNEVSLRKENLKEKISEEEGLSLEEFLPNFQAEQFHSEEAAREMEDLKEKLSRLGAVNVQSIQELESLEGRLRFIQGQEEDLLQSKSSLLEAIRRLNQKSRSRFEETFNNVRANFGKVFRKLFGGGRADIFLQDEGNVLESGIEIMAKPPGKEMVPLTLLSGGEKVMTAVALLFALFMARPSPFCVLDEVDAALDDSNIERFLGLLKNFLDRSQFLVISHNKKTMSIADALYGITMDDAGISRKISVNFRTARKMEPQAAT